MMNTNDFLNFLNTLSADFDIRGDVVDTTELINNKHFITIDTCYTNDTGRYETGIKIDSDQWIIVESYPNRASAVIGHDEWIKRCNMLPIELLNIQDGEIYIYE